MATIPRAAVDYLNAEVNDISTDAQERVRRVLEQITWTPDNIANCREIVLEALDLVMGTYTDLSAQAAADFYDAERTLCVGEPLGAKPLSGYSSDATAGAVRALVQGIVDGGDVETFNQRVLERVDYDVRRAAGNSVIENGLSDDLDVRFARVPTGAETCNFCLMLSSRGFVYHSEQSAGALNHYHPHCDCKIVASFDRDTVQDYDPKDLYLKWKDPEAWRRKHEGELNESGELDTQPETLADVRRGAPMSWDDADGLRANPHFGDRSQSYEDYVGYKNNCQTCVVAFEARLRGYDVSALPNTKKHPTLDRLAHNTSLAWIDPRTGKHPEYIKDESVTNARKCMSWLDETIESGHRYTIEFGWKGRGHKGHIIDVGRDEDGYLYLYDPQCGERYSGRDVVTHVYTDEEMESRRSIFGARSARARQTERTRNEMLEYLDRIRYQSTVSGIKYWNGPRVLQVDTMDIDPEIANEVLEAAK